jgi:hypothetical protein
MAVADHEVDASHWEHAAKPPAVPTLRRALRHFAEDRGMDALALDALDLAVCEVVAHGVWAVADGWSDDAIVIDAAADHQSMSVWVTYGRSAVDDPVLPLAMLLADRVETAVLRPSERTRVILEFALVPDALLVDPDEAGACRVSSHG